MGADPTREQAPVRDESIRTGSAAPDPGHRGSSAIATPADQAMTIANTALAEHANGPNAEADSNGAQADIRDRVDVVTQSFHWFNEAAQLKIDQLRRELKEEDEPSWVGELVEGVVELGLGTGAATAGKFLAGKLVHGAGAVTKEFVEDLFSGGAEAGIKAGLAKLGGGKDEHVIDPFIDAQKEGVSITQMKNQTRWLTHGRHQVRTLDEATRLKEACSEIPVKAAAEEQYQATRDAWVAYLAQARFGAVGKHGPVTKDSVNTGPTRTDMSTQAQRDRDAKGTIGYRDAADAPDFRDAAQGDAPGVLEVVAELPRIVQGMPGMDVTNVMEGRPKVMIAILNGVNDTIRKQYEGTSLADMHIPRQVQAKVDGAPDFALNLDEQGNANFVHKPQSTWLQMRATVGHPENATLGDYDKQARGRELLLGDLVATGIVKKIF